MAIQYDPDLPIYPDAAKYKAPELTDPTAQLGELKSADSYLDPAKATSAGQANTLLTQGGGIIDSARADAVSQAKARGLENSTMAATAGTKAAIDSITPFAINDANLYGDMAKANQTTSNQGVINNQAAQIVQNKTANDATIAGATQEQTFANTISAKGFEGGIEKQIAKMQLDAAAKIALANNISSQTNTLMSNIGSLLGNPDIELNDNVVGQMSDFMYSSIEGISSLFNLDISVT